MAGGARNRPVRGGKPIGDLPIAAGLILLAWIHRLFFLFSNLDHSWPFTIFYEGDSETFYDYARAILNGSVYDGGIPFHPPAFPYLLSVVHALIGAGPGVERVPYVPLKICLAFVGSLPIGLVYLLARPYLGRTVALTGAMFALYSFGLYVMAVAPVSESLYTALLLSSLLVWTRRFQHPLAAPGAGGNSQSLASPATGKPGTDRSGARLWGAVLGALLGLLCLTRAEGVLVALLILTIGAIPAVMGNRASRSGSRAAHEAARPGNEAGRWPRLRPWVVAAVGMVLVIVPWTIRNAVRLHAVNVALAEQLAHPLPEFVPITAYGPLNFALANNELANGTFSRDILTSQSQSATLDIRDPQHLDFFLHGYQIGWTFIREHPGKSFELVLSRWKLLFDSLRLGWTQWNVPGGLVGVRRPVDLFVPDSALGLWINALLMLGGLALLLRRAILLRSDDREPSSELPAASGTDSQSASGPGRPQRSAHGAFRGERRWLGIVALVTGCALVTTGLFFGYARFGVMLLPIWFTLSATLLVAIASWIGHKISGPGAREPSFLQGRTLLLLVVIPWFLLEAWGATGDRNYRATGTQAEGAGHLNPHDTMHLEVISKSE